VLATTDPQKLPATVLSRCQRFDFRRIPVPIMVRHMQAISGKEGFGVEPGVLELVARQATGCMRDALSLLDQLMSFADGTLTLAQVQAVLGARGTAEVSGFVDRLIAGDMAGGLHGLHAAIEAGADPRPFNRQVVDHLRSLLLLRAGGAGVALDATEEEVAALRAQAERTQLPALSAWIRAFSSADTGLKGGLYGALPLELALVEAHLGTTAAPAAVVSNAVAGNPQPAARNPQSAPPVARPTPAPATAETPPVYNRERPAAPTASPRPTPAPAVATDTPSPNSQSAEAGDVDAILDGWGRVIEGLRPRNQLQLQALLRNGRPVSMEGSVITLGFSPKYEFHRSKLEEPKNRGIIEEVMAEVYGHPYKLRFVPMSDEDLSRHSAARPAAAPAAVSRAQKARAIIDEDF
jgi:DNA polymerase-3 subunit gamma/tau